jgi:hypothetical protein
MTDCVGSVLIRPLSTTCYEAGCLVSPNTTLLVLVTWPVMEGEVKFLYSTIPTLVTVAATTDLAIR